VSDDKKSHGHVYKYKSYDEYKKEQQGAASRKWGNSFVDPNSLKKLVLSYISDNFNIKPKLILCHGTRRGEEQKVFLDFYSKDNDDLQVIGTEIMSGVEDRLIKEKQPGANHTITWDFHDVKDEWINNVDIIYSNSFDHSWKPEECLDTWMSCLNKTGLCIIEYDDICDGGLGGSVDCFGATLEEYKQLISKKYDIVDILKNDNIKDKSTSHRGDGKRNYIIIRNK